MLNMYSGKMRAISSLSKIFLVLFYLTVSNKGYSQKTTLFNNIGDSLEYVLGSVKEADKKAELLTSLSDYYMMKDLEKASGFILQAVLLIPSIKQNEIKLKIYKQAGSVCFFVGIFDEASRFFIESFSIARQMEDSLHIAKSAFNLGALYIAVKDFELANENLEIAKKFFLTKSDRPEFRPNIHSVLNNQAIILQNIGSLTEAKVLFKDAIQFAIKFDLKEGIKTSLNALATFLIERGEYLEAKNVLFTLDSLNNVYNYSPQIHATILIKQSRVEGVLGNKQDSKGKLFTAMDLVPQIRSVSLYKELANDLYLFELHEGNELEALRYKVIYDSLLKEEKVDVALREGLKNKLTSEFQSLEKVVESKHKIQRRNYTIAFFLLGLVLFVFFFITLKVRRSKKQLFADKIKIEKEKELLSEEKTVIADVVEKKEKELATLAIHHMRQKEILRSSIEELKKSIQELPVVSRQAESKINQMASVIEDRQVWSDFDIRFNELNTGFYQKLDIHFPELTINEKRLCAFLKLEMNTKEIIAITGQSIRAVEIARTRLRKKLGLTNSSRSLNDFFKTF
jgi:tetratricopeptide (TPR) repeat protein